MTDNYVHQVLGLPLLDLETELKKLFDCGRIEWKPRPRTQLCVNTTKEDPGNIHLGAGSLTHDWHRSYQDDAGKLVVPDKKIILRERDFNIIAEPFVGTLFEEVYLALEQRYYLGRVRIMNLLQKTCLSWHTDTHQRLHYPITTDEGCFMLIENSVHYLEKYKWYMTETRKKHTAINSSPHERLHLVATIIDEK